MSKRGKFIKIVIFFRGLWRRSIYYQYPKCGHGMVGTVGRGRGGGAGENYFPFILFNEIKTMLSQLAKQSHWNLSADSSIADKNYVLSRKKMAVN